MVCFVGLFRGWLLCRCVSCLIWCFNSLRFWFYFVCVLLQVFTVFVYLLSFAMLFGLKFVALLWLFMI